MFVTYIGIFARLISCSKHITGDVHKKEGEKQYIDENGSLDSLKDVNYIEKTKKMKFGNDITDVNVEKMLASIDKTDNESHEKYVMLVDDIIKTKDIEDLAFEQCIMTGDINKKHEEVKRTKVGLDGLGDDILDIDTFHDRKIGFTDENDIKCLKRKVDKDCDFDNNCECGCGNRLVKNYIKIDERFNTTAYTNAIEYENATVNTDATDNTDATAYTNAIEYENATVNTDATDNTDATEYDNATLYENAIEYENTTEHENIINNANKNELNNKHAIASKVNFMKYDVNIITNENELNNEHAITSRVDISNSDENIINFANENDLHKHAITSKVNCMNRDENIIKFANKNCIEITSDNDSQTDNEEDQGKNSMYFNSTNLSEDDSNFDYTFRHRYDQDNDQMSEFIKKSENKKRIERKFKSDENNVRFSKNFIGTIKGPVDMVRNMTDDIEDGLSSANSLDNTSDDQEYDDAEYNFSNTENDSTLLNPLVSQPNPYNPESLRNKTRIHDLTMELIKARNKRRLFYKFLNNFTKVMQPNDTGSSSDESVDNLNVSYQLQGHEKEHIEKLGNDDTDDSLMGLNIPIIDYEKKSNEVLNKIRKMKDLIRNNNNKNFLNNPMDQNVSDSDQIKIHNSSKPFDSYATDLNTFCDNYDPFSNQLDICAGYDTSHPQNDLNNYTIDHESDFMYNINDKYESNYCLSKYIKEQTEHECFHEPTDLRMQFHQKNQHNPLNKQRIPGETDMRNILNSCTEYSNFESDKILHLSQSNLKETITSDDHKDIPVFNCKKEINDYKNDIEMVKDIADAKNTISSSNNKFETVKAKLHRFFDGGAILTENKNQPNANKKYFSISLVGDTTCNVEIITNIYITKEINKVLQALITYNNSGIDAERILFEPYICSIISMLYTFDNNMYYNICKTDYNNYYFTIKKSVLMDLAKMLCGKEIYKHKIYINNVTVYFYYSYKQQCRKQKSSDENKAFFIYNEQQIKYYNELIKRYSERVKKLESSFAYEDKKLINFRERTFDELKTPLDLQEKLNFKINNDHLLIDNKQSQIVEKDNKEIHISIDDDYEMHDFQKISKIPRKKIFYKNNSSKTINLTLNDDNVRTIPKEILRSQNTIREVQSKRNGRFKLTKYVFNYNIELIQNEMPIKDFIDTQQTNLDIIEKMEHLYKKTKSLFKKGLNLEEYYGSKYFQKFKELNILGFDFIGEQMWLNNDCKYAVMKNGGIKHLKWNQCNQNEDVLVCSLLIYRIVFSDVFNFLEHVIKFYYSELNQASGSFIIDYNKKSKNINFKKKGYNTNQYILSKPTSFKEKLENKKLCFDKKNILKPLFLTYKRTDQKMSIHILFCEENKNYTKIFYLLCVEKTLNNFNKNIYTIEQFSEIK
ncbi:hypothetical protein COBT_001185 [Conglomerata obtusa]